MNRGDRAAGPRLAGLAGNADKRGGKMSRQPFLRLPAQPVTTGHLLQSIAEVTDNQDCRNFRRSLVETIREILPVDEMAFMRPVRGESKYELLYVDPVPSRRGSQQIVPTVEWHEVLSADRIEAMTMAGEFVGADADSAIALLPVFHRDALVEVVALRAAVIPQATLDVMKSFIRLYRNFRALIFQSETDPLTGLLNRKTLETELGRLVRDAAEIKVSGKSSSTPDCRGAARATATYLAVIDIDNFKRINDTLGHLFGDEVILLVARLMRDSFRDRDLLFRYGGEEFVVVLPAQTSAGAITALERFRRRVASHRFPQLESVTVSIGFVEVDFHDLVASIISRADSALYQAKAQGKNRTIYYRDLVSSAAVPKLFGTVEIF
jgi:two-component system cell cycle response regulator